MLKWRVSVIQISTYAFLLLCLTHAKGVFAQKYWSLEECIQTALKNNITIKQRELTVKAAKSDFNQSKLALLPSVNGQATNNWNVGFAINPVTNTAERDVTFRNNAFGVNANMNVFNGFQQTNTIRLQQGNMKAAQMDELTAKNNIALQVSNAYLQTLMNQEIYESRKLQVAATTAQLTRQQKMYELGGVNKTRLLQLKAQLANEELLLINAENALQQSYFTLWQNINILPDTANKIIKPNVDATTIKDEVMSSEQVYEAFAKRSPELKAAKERSRNAYISKQIAIGGRSPRITFGAGINSFYTTQNMRGAGSPVLVNIPIGIDINNNPVFTSRPFYSSTEVIPFRTQFDQNLGRNYGFTLLVPIFNGWQVNNNINRSRINQKSAELAEQQTIQETQRNINQAYLDFKASLKRYEANVQNLDASKESFNVAETQYALGTLSINEYLATKNTYLQAETNYLQAKYELVFRRKVLDFYLGQPLY